MGEDLIRFDRPAVEWNEGLPLGNGRLGSMVLSSQRGEILELNEGTLWSGLPRADEGPASSGALPRARELLKKERYREAQDVLEAGMGGRTPEAFQPLGTLRVLRFCGDDGGGKASSSFSRALDLRSGIANVSTTRNDRSETRETFVSAVDGVLAFRWSSDREVLRDIDIAFSSPHPTARIEAADREILLLERMPTHAPGDPAGNGSEPLVYEEDRGVLCCARLRLILEGGFPHARVSRENSLRAWGARSLMLLLAVETNFASWEAEPGNDEEALFRACGERLDAAERSGWEALRARHVDDHRRLFDRVSIEIGPLPESRE